MLKIGCLAAALILAAGSLPALGKRVALVIGNSEYLHTPSLPNPRNDASDMAATLRKLGFVVIEGRDLDKAAMDRTLRAFAAELGGAQAGLFFYAGHGVQVAGVNYLVPVDAKLAMASAIEFEMVRLDLVHRAMERETSTNILIMDACRDNPLARSLARTLGTRSTQIGRGLAAVESGEGTLISYSTQPGNVALDGTGRNSPYTKALLRHIATPGDDLPSILIKVRNDVMKDTERRQVPWEHSALTAKFYFIPPVSTAEQIEMQFWDTVKGSDSPVVLNSYLVRYPGGAFAALARAMIEQLGQPQDGQRATMDPALRLQDAARRQAEHKQLEAQRAAADSQTKLLQKILEEVRVAKEVAKNAEEQRVLAVKAAEEQRVLAVKAAEEARRSSGAAAEKGAERQKVAALPQLAAPFDGSWQMVRLAQGCQISKAAPMVAIRSGKVSGQFGAGSIDGSVSAAGVVRFTHPALGGGHHNYSGTLQGNAGSGTFTHSHGPCAGTFTFTRR